MIPVRTDVWQKRVVFVLLVVCFTLFGGGTYEKWTIVCHDQQGFTYEVDDRSIQRVGDTVSLRVRTARDGHWRDSRWSLDLDGNTLAVDGKDPTPIMSGSVAWQVVSYLRQQKKILPSSLNVPEKVSSGDQS